MNPIDDLLEDTGAPIDDGVTLMAELVAAVTWLRRGAMPGLTIWDAIEQALRWQSRSEVDWREADPLRAAMHVALTDHQTLLPKLLGKAIRSWLTATSHSFNDGVAW